MDVVIPVSSVRIACLCNICLEPFGKMTYFDELSKAMTWLGEQKEEKCKGELYYSKGSSL